MIVFDTESTGLMKSGLARLADQPHLIEIGAVRTDDEATFHRLVRPPVAITAETTKITGITQADVDRDGVPVAPALDAFADFVRGQRIWVAHNLAHDVGVLTTELRRLGREYKFPYPDRHVCTVEHTSDLGLKDRKLLTLYEYLFGERPKQDHRALADVQLLQQCVTALCARGLVVL